MSSKVKKNDNSTNSAFIGKITDYIANNYTENITLKDISKKLSYNYSYLSRNFKRLFGICFNDFVNLYRIEKAISLLSEENTKIANIALESGFQSVRSFNAIFIKKWVLPQKNIK